ncbi:MAG TPA: response regulator [Euryarchaeota archaeon]|nr:response regulator ArlR [archaeon BMS3Bbin15]HDL14709.1 response regulator [Euryarchaeota archaeon]
MAKILVVDDEPDVAYLVKKILTDINHEVETANSGKEALDKIHSGYKPDLILLDVMMPEMDGWEVSRRIKENPSTKDVIITMFTVRSDDEDKVTSLDRGLADWHISKPFKKDTLIRTVEWLLTKPLKRED